MHDETPRDLSKRLHFDPTINAGHILTVVSMLLIGLASWTNLDKRVVVLEEAKTYQQKRDDAQDTAIRDKLTDIKDRLGEIQNSMNDLRKSK